MKPVHLYFEPRDAAAPHRWRRDARVAPRWQQWLMAAALCSAGFTCLALGNRLWQRQDELARTNEALQAASARTRALRSSHTSPQPELSPQERAAWSRVAGALNIPWSGVFDTLESAIPTNVAVISIEPDASSSTLRLEMEAATLEAVLKGAQALGAADGVAQVALVKHETQQQHPDRPVRLRVDIRLQRDVP